MSSIIQKQTFDANKLIAIISEFDNYKFEFFNSFSHDAQILIKEKEYSSKKNKLIKKFSKDNNFYNYFKLNQYNFGKQLEKEDNIFLTLLEALYNKPLTIIINDLLTWLKIEQKELIFKYAKEKNIRIINLTSNIEEVLYTDYLIVLNKNKVCLENTTLEVLKEEKTLKSLGFSLPFYYDLSLQLNYYEVLSKIYLDKETLEAAIWK